ncbi:hypothetical protein ACVPOB_001987 [Enterobacter hormaechei]
MNQIREGANLTVDVRFGLVNARGVCLSGQTIVGRVDGITAVVRDCRLRRQERKHLANHFKYRAQDVADNALRLVENLDMVQLAQLKRQLIIVAQPYAVADDQQVAVESSVIVHQPVIKKGAVWHPATQLRRSWKIRYLNQRHKKNTPLW